MLNSCTKKRLTKFAKAQLNTHEFIDFDKFAVYLCLIFSALPKRTQQANGLRPDDKKITSRGTVANLCIIAVVMSSDHRLVTKQEKQTHR